MSTDPSEVDRELLELCGYVRVHDILVGEGQSVSFNLINGWKQVALTSSDLGGEGSALGSTKQVTVWALPGSAGLKSWRYDITVQYGGEDLNVVAMRSAAGEQEELITRRGKLVALDLPTPLEMLAAQADHFSDDGVQDEGPPGAGEDGAD